MKTLGQLAAEAAKELRRRKLPEDRPATRAFADRINYMVGSMRDFHANTWRKIAAKLNENLEHDADVYLWARGIAGEVSLLAIAHQNQISEGKLTMNVRALCRATRDVTRPRRKRKK